MNCSNTGTCLTSKYGVTLDEETGDLTGEAWSSNVGWLQFGGYNTTDFPVDSSTQSINANIDTDNGSMNGWARFLGFGDDVLDGLPQLAWDGWVSLSGQTTDNSTYGPTRTGDTISGYAWGDDVVGWIDFSGVSLSESPAQCGTANAINISTKPVTDFCDTGTLSGVVSQADQYSWIWTCLNESSSAQCGASCSINEWICGDECISTSETCGNNTGSCPAGQIEDPSNPGVCIENTGSYNGDITAFIAQPRIINSGEECSLNWAVYTEDASSVLCEVVPDGGDTIKIDPEDGNLGNVKSGTVKYENVTSSTNYTMSCYGAVGGDELTIKTKTSTLLSEETAKCIINPTFIEF